MLQQAIHKINNDFISEAVSSPNLLEDMASMEKYMSESYNGRIFVELLQNADDNGSNRILLTEINGHIIFANDGRRFDENDVIAISRSGASFKKRGATIGYRGIGFKSTTYLTGEIIIYSDNTYFTFSKSICSKALNKSEDKIPTVRIPFLIENVDREIDTLVDELVSAGYSTVFIFKNSKIDSFMEELKEISNGYFIFLRHIAHCDIKVKNINESFSVRRQKSGAKHYVDITGKTKDNWLVINDETTSVALKLKDGKVVPCDAAEAVYHCYLPTYDKVAFPIKVNGDFSTDPSRKHLTNDDLTDKALFAIADLLFDVLRDTFDSENIEVYSGILEILLQTSSFSRANSLFRERLKSKIVSSKWLPLNNQKKISADQYMLLPSWLEDSEKILVRQKSNYVNALSLNARVYGNIIGVDNFLSQYSSRTLTTENLITIMEDSNFVSSINSKTSGKIFAYIIKAGKSAQSISGQIYEYKNIAINTTSGVSTIGEIANESAELTADVKETISQIASSNEISWFSKKESIAEESIKVAPENKHENIVNTVTSSSLRPSVSKWRSAEQQCVEMEKHLGNTAIDVSRQNVGYDIESTTPTGNKRYIEVKLLPSGGGAFSMTNNEYTAAHQYGNNYYLCLITQNDKEAKMLYICNPLETLSFEKRIRQWEWYCEQYSGVEYSIDIK